MMERFPTIRPSESAALASKRYAPANPSFAGGVQWTSRRVSKSLLVASNVPLAVLLVGVTLGSTRGAAAAALYLLEGFSGLPVFAQGHGGAIWLAGPTAGYLFSYPFAAFVAGWFSERGWGSTIVRAIAGMLVALTVIYLGGWSWLAAFAGAKGAWLGGVRPFILADIVKVAVGQSLLPQLQRLMSRI